MRKRHATALGIGVGVAAALLAHLVYWYVPRERQGAPSEAARRLLAEDGWQLVAWLPYPHQNLARLEARVGDLRRWLEMVAPPGRSVATRLPGFGPWSLPPSRELVVAAGADALRIELETYPVIGAAARASGKLAGNPWLAGGEVPWRGGRARVEWSSGRWCLVAARGRTAPAGAQPEPAELDESLGWIRLDEPIGWMPGGDFRLTRGAGGLELRSGAPPKAPLPPLGEVEPRPAAWRVERVGRRTVEAIVLWQEPSAVPPLPAALTLERGSARRLRLPGEELLRVAGGEPRRARASGFALRALTDAEIERGESLAAELAGRLADRQGLGRYAGIRPDALAEAARRVAASLRGLPIGGLLGVEPERLAALIAPLHGCDASVLEVWNRPPAVRWRVCVDEPDSVPPR